MGWLVSLNFFSADIQFWNKNKSMEGLSAKSVIVSFICQLIVFLYLLDNDTSWMILISSGIGCCIEFWKIGKAMHIEVCQFKFAYCHNVLGQITYHTLSYFFFPSFFLDLLATLFELCSKFLERVN